MTIERAMERGMETDVYSLYLRPVATGPLAELFNRQNEKWGGAHITLCSFAPEAPQGHARSLLETMAIAQAAMVAAPEWRLGRTTWRRKKNGSGLAIQVPPAPALHALVAAVAAGGASNARKLDQLHMTVAHNLEDGDHPLYRMARVPESGEEPVPPPVEEYLLNCSWELRIAKCCQGEPTLRTSELQESLPVHWNKDEKEETNGKPRRWKKKP